MTEKQSQLEAVAPTQALLTPPGTGACPIPPKGRKWIARLGVGAFFFFLIKGLLWLIVPAALVWWGAL